MPTITTAQIKSTLQSTKQSAANKLHSAGQSTKDALKKAAEQTRNVGNRLILLIPKDYKGQGSSLNDLVRTADELGIEVQYDEKNGTAITKQVFGTAEKLIGLTERGVTIFAPQLDKLLQKYQKAGNKLGGSAENIGDNLGKAGSVLSTFQNFLGTALSSMKIDELIKKQKSGGNVSSSELAKASIELINQLVDTVASLNNNVNSFSQQLNKLGSLLSNTKHLNGVGNKLQNLPNLDNIGAGLDTVSGILSAISASFILSNADADTGTKAAAGVELTTKVLGNVGKGISQYIIAQRAAQGLSTSAAAAGLIASVVTLAISPLSFLSIADKFKRANKIEEYSQRFKKLGYDGDSLLAAFHKETGAIDASLTTISTVLASVSSGISAAATTSLVGAPVSALVGAVTGIISGILEASKQAMFEHVASKMADVIAEWEKKHGKNYFENGYDARHAAFLEDNFKILSQYNKEYSVERAVLITQQHWDTLIGELAGVTRNGDKTLSGKSYIDYYEEGKRLEKKTDEFQKQVFDPLKGNINLSDSKSSTLLKFVTPLLTPGEEIRERRQSGKYEYITELLVKGVDKWTVKGVQDKGSVYDYSNLIQHASVGNNQYREIRIESHLGDGDDKVFLSAGPANIYAGKGHDVVYYDKTDTGYLTIDGTKATEAGNYTVTRVLGGDVKVLQEVVKEQEVSVGKRTEKTQYRSYEFTHINGKNLTETDNLYSVEELIGTTRADKFFGSKFTDIFHGADGDDHIEGNDGNDRLYGDKGNDTLSGGNGDDQLYGGDGNDKLIGGAGNNYLNGGDGDDELQVQGNSLEKNVLSGGKGNDKLYGSEGADLLDGGEGNDLLKGGYGNDIYRYLSGYGHHIIDDDGGKEDKLSLADIDFRDVAFRREGNDLIMYKAEGNVLSIGHKNGITFRNWFEKESGDISNHQIEQIFDKDGRVITPDSLKKAFEYQQSNNKVSYVYGHDASTYGSQDNLNPLINEISKIISAAGNFDVKEERTAASLLQLSGNTSDFSYGRNSITLTASA
ncbi:RTX toxin hemolysin HlyA [Escherichia coli]|uniref:RTX toxin hemolysin HlyA n=1 Tax=Enterobacteriaceae TaxID=543 RepID=UPI00079A6959|nr:MULTISPECIES: RTX toxin hemolysin HlyA [Enterobacteriaceae]ECZ4224931.1 RTX toxin hemolysin HlyA [Salmonella enterica]EEI8585990.1 RTX toxin hemolysin HlyA [Salmonella enterica subsp. enterica serovar 4,[5],12:i:-]EGD4985912.1 RTX toxin hemolysin A [Shigella sonnei]EHG0201867.1 RTX toxin hemolysin HlyA [Salmonella enterica subsp. enterica serovar Napoli]EIV2219988.1 RTX toxin hemolysin HlyA [Salmonella enterica subsp. enterica serovar Reading]EJU0469803.1 RTX toxin hemolysin HlyA [Shigella